MEGASKNLNLLLKPAALKRGGICLQSHTAEFCQLVSQKEPLGILLWMLTAVGNITSSSRIPAAESRIFAGLYGFSFSLPRFL